MYFNVSNPPTPPLPCVLRRLRACAVSVDPPKQHRMVGGVWGGWESRCLFCCGVFSKVGTLKSVSKIIEKRENTLENKLPRVFLSNFYFGPMYANRQVSQPVHTALRAVGAARRDSAAWLCDLRTAVVWYFADGCGLIFCAFKGGRDSWQGPSNSLIFLVIWADPDELWPCHMALIIILVSLT